MDGTDSLSALPVNAPVRGFASLRHAAWTRQVRNYASVWALLAASIALSLGTAAVLSRCATTLSTGAAWVAHTERIRFEVAQLLSSMSILGRGLTGFDSTQGRDWFAPALAVDAEMSGQIAALEQSADLEPNERELVARLVDLARQRRLQTQSARERDLNGEMLSKQELSLESEKIMDPARRIAERIQAEETVVLSRHEAVLSAARFNLQLGIGTAAVLAVVLLSSVAWLTVRHSERRRKLEQEGAAERRSTETRVHAILDASPVGLSLLRPIRDDTGHIVDFSWTLINRTGAVMLDRAADFLVGRRVSEVFPHIWDDAEFFGKLINAFESATPQTFETDNCLSARAGGFYQVACRVGDELLMWFADFTERTRAAQEIAERERRFVALANAMPQQVWVAGADGHVSYVNRRWCDYTGLSLGDAQAPATLASIIHVEDRENSSVAWLRSLNDGVPYEMEQRLQGRDGSYRWFLTRAVAERDEQGRVLGWYGTSTDIDEGKRVSKALRDADRRKDEFLATLSHELRNPLAPIRNAAQILSSPALAPTQLQWAHRVIQRQVKHMAWLLDDLLDVARITRGKLELKRERVPLSSIIEPAIEAARPLIDLKQHELSIRVPEGPVFVFADTVRLSQILGNLLTNAAKYTKPCGRIECEVSVAGEALRILVRDNGIGIAPEHLEHVFDMFAQIDQGVSRTEGGLGIGLSIVKGLTELHGGTVTVRSAGHGQGSEFALTLPVVDSAKASDTAAPAAGGAASVRGRRVLVADDNHDAGDSLAMLLELFGHEVRVAHCGGDALEQARSFLPEFVLLDIGMPDLSGYDVAAELRRQPWGTGMRLIALTGWGQDRDRQRAKEAGFDHHLTKPVDTDALQRTLVS